MRDRRHVAYLLVIVAISFLAVLVRELPAPISSGGGGGSGETNTASNIGAAGVGVFDGKSGVDLQFRNINVTTDETTVTDDSANDEIDIGIADNPVLPGTGSVQVPSGTTAQRPGSPANGDVRYNTTTSKFEGYEGGSWLDLRDGSGSAAVASTNHGNGVYQTHTENAGMEVKAQGTPDMTVHVLPGSAIVEGQSVLQSTGDASVTITAADASNERIDIITVDTAGAFAAVAGTPAASPVAPSVPAGEIILAEVSVPAMDTSIESGQITDKREFISWDTRAGVYSVRNYDAGGSRQVVTGSVTATDATLTTDSAHDYVAGQGIVVWGAGPDGGITLPATAPLLVENGAGSGTTYEYEVRYTSGNGDWTVTQTSSNTIDGPASLDGTNNITIQITPPTNGIGVAIYGRSDVGTKTLLVVLPLMEHGGETIMEWTDEGDTNRDYDNRSWVWTASTEFYPGQLIVDTSKIYRVIRVHTDRLSGTSKPTFPSGFNSDVADDIGRQDIVWRRAIDFVPVDDTAGEVNEWLKTTVASVTSQTELELSDTATVTVSSNSVSHSDAAAFRAALQEVRDAYGGTMYISPGYYPIPIGWPETDAHTDDVSNSQRAVLWPYLQEPGNDQNNARDIERTGGTKGIRIEADPAAVTILQTAGMPISQHNGVSSSGQDLALINPTMANWSVIGGWWEWWDVGGGLYEKPTGSNDADNLVNGIAHSSDRWHGLVQGGTWNAWPTPIRGGNGLTFDDTVTREKLTVRDVNIPCYGGAGGNRAIGLQAGSLHVDDVFAEPGGRRYTLDFVRFDGGSSTECRVTNCEVRGIGGNFIDARGGSEYVFSGNLAEDITQGIDVGGSKITLAGNTLINCNLTGTSGPDGITVSGNHMEGSGITFSSTGNVRDITITGNQFSDASTVFTGVDAENITVTGNTFAYRADAGSSLFDMGQPDSLLFSGNTLIVSIAQTGTEIFNFNASGAGEIKISGNIIKVTATDDLRLIQLSTKTVNRLEITDNYFHWANFNNTDRWSDVISLTTTHTRVLNNLIDVSTVGTRIWRWNVSAGTVELRGNTQVQADGDWELEGSGIELYDNEINGFDSTGGILSAGRNSIAGNPYGTRKGTSGSASPNAAVDTYGDEVQVFTGDLLLRVNNLNVITRLAFTTSGVSGETVTVRVTATRIDATTATVEKTSTTNETIELTLAEIDALLKEGEPIRDITVAIKSSIMSSAASATMSVSGM